MARSSLPLPSVLCTTYFDWNALVAKPTSVGCRYSVVDSATPTFPRLTIHVTTLDAGAPVQAARSHAQEEAILVKEGKLDVLLNGKTVRATAGSLIFLSAHAVHNVTNVGTTPATYYVFDVYTWITETLPERPVDERASRGALRSCVFDCERMPRTRTPLGSRISIVEAPTATYAQFESHLTTIAPGKGTDVLTDPADEVIVIKSGVIESCMNGVAVRLGPGSFYFQAAGAPHSSKNVGPTPATYQVLKWVAPGRPRSAKP